MALSSKCLFIQSSINSLFYLPVTSASPAILLSSKCLFIQSSITSLYLPVTSASPAMALSSKCLFIQSSITSLYLPVTSASTAMANSTHQLWHVAVSPCPSRVQSLVSTSLITSSSPASPHQDEKSMYEKVSTKANHCMQS